MGFTLLELVMVMTIMVTLAAVGVVNYQRVREKAKETLLKDDLKTMRKLIDQYSADKETLPDSLDDLVSASYLREVPVDPISGKADWDLEMGDDPFSRTTKQGVVDIHSKAPGLDSEGRAFTDY
jgi:general secretion pathway protein G